MRPAIERILLLLLLLLFFLTGRGLSFAFVTMIQFNVLGKNVNEAIERLKNIS